MTPWTVARQAPLSMEFTRQEYWSRLPFPSSGDRPDPGIDPGSPAQAGDGSPTLQADSLPSEPAGEPRDGLKQELKSLFKNASAVGQHGGSISQNETLKRLF